MENLDFGHTGHRRLLVVIGRRRSMLQAFDVGAAAKVLLWPTVPPSSSGGGKGEEIEGELARLARPFPRVGSQVSRF